MSLINMEIQKSNIPYLDKSNFLLPNNDYYEGRCGEIFITHGKILVFICSICDYKYEAFDDFLEHISSKHYQIMNVKNEDDNNVKNEEEDEVEYLIQFEDECEFEETKSSNRETAQIMEISIDEIQSANDNSESCVSEDMKLFKKEIYNSKVTNETDEESLEDIEYKNTKILLNDEGQDDKDQLPEIDEITEDDASENLDSENSTIFKCKICSKIFTTETKLKSHIRSHSKERKYKCDECGFAFSEMFNLRAHIKRHKGIKPFNCKYCHKCFSSRTELDTHSRVHTGERPFVCETCGNRFATSGSLNEHKKRHNNYRPHKCNECGKSFFDTYMLKEHRVTHSGERSHICPHCQAGFTRRKSLIVHMKLHSDIKEYICGICNKAFAQKPGLVAHRKIHKIPDVFPKIKIA